MVDEQSRRIGVGRQLMRGAEEWATSAGAAYIALATRRADQFYRAMGYEDSAVFFRRQLKIGARCGIRSRDDARATAQLPMSSTSR